MFFIQVDKTLTITSTSFISVEIDGNKELVVSWLEGTDVRRRRIDAKYPEEALHRVTLGLARAEFLLSRPPEHKVSAYSSEDEDDYRKAFRVNISGIVSGSDYDEEKRLNKKEDGGNEGQGTFGCCIKL